MRWSRRGCLAGFGILLSVPWGCCAASEGKGAVTGPEEQRAGRQIEGLVGTAIATPPGVFTGRSNVSGILGPSEIEPILERRVGDYVDDVGGGVVGEVLEEVAGREVLWVPFWNPVMGVEHLEFRDPSGILSATIGSIYEGRFSDRIEGLTVGELLRDVLRLSTWYGTNSFAGYEWPYTNVALFTDESIVVVAVPEVRMAWEE